MASIHSTGTPPSHDRLNRWIVAIGVAVMLIVILSVAWGAAWAAPAGLRIDNVAQLNFNAGGQPMSLSSNTVSVRLQEVVDVQVQAAAPTVAVTSGAASQAMAFTVTNTGNGPGAFELSANAAQTGDAFDPVLRDIVIDSNGDGRLDLSTDAVYRPGVNAPALAAGGSVTVWVICDIPVGRATGDQGVVVLTAISARGHGVSGTVLPSQGPGGVDALIGSTTAQASARAAYRVGALVATAGGGVDRNQLIKTQSVSDAAGGSRAMPGSTITYSLEARFVAATRNAVITDTAPQGSSYLPGTLRLDGVALSDAADGDSGRVTGGAVAVQLGDIPGPESRVVTFQVRINPLETP